MSGKVDSVTYQKRNAENISAIVISCLNRNFPAAHDKQKLVVQFMMAPQ